MNKIYNQPAHKGNIHGSYGVQATNKNTAKGFMAIKMQQF